MSQEFKTEDVVSLYTGIMLVSLDGVYDILSFLAGVPVWTHQLPVQRKKALPIIEACCPQLIGEVAPQGKPDEIPAYIESLHERYGKTLTLEGKIDLDGADSLIEDRPIIQVVVKD
jgi:hypothetical protein